MKIKIVEVHDGRALNLRLESEEGEQISLLFERGKNGDFFPEIGRASNAAVRIIKAGDREEDTLKHRWPNEDKWRPHANHLRRFLNRFKSES